jgi:hypothetical protein
MVERAIIDFKNGVLPTFSSFFFFFVWRFHSLPRWYPRVPGCLSCFARYACLSPFSHLSCFLSHRRLRVEPRRLCAAVPDALLPPRQLCVWCRPHAAAAHGPRLHLQRLHPGQEVRSCVRMRLCVRHPLACLLSSPVPLTRSPPSLTASCTRRSSGSKRP